MYHTTMKRTLISIYILLSFLFLSYSPTYAQENITGETENTQETTTLKEAVDDITTLKETLDIAEDESVKLNFFQIFVAVFAPLTLITIAYLLIKKLKL